jgi:hypothetical protein
MINRRSFLSGAGALFAASLGDLSEPLLTGATTASAAPGQGADSKRKQQAFQIRQDAAQLAPAA